MKKMNMIMKIIMVIPIEIKPSTKRIQKGKIMMILIILKIMKKFMIIRI